MYDKVRCFHTTSLWAGHGYRLLFWLSEGSSAISRERERCCDEKRCLVRCVEQILERKRRGGGRGGETERCCDVIWLLGMWSVPTYGNEKEGALYHYNHASICKIRSATESFNGKTNRQTADIISPIYFFQKEKQDIVKLQPKACSHLVRRVRCNVSNIST